MQGPYETTFIINLRNLIYHILRAKADNIIKKCIGINKIKPLLHLHLNTSLLIQSLSNQLQLMSKCVTLNVRIKKL